jgi:hypothetical protein
MIATLTSMNIFDQISTRIIKEQELIIGPMAWEEARKVSGLTVVNAKSGEVNLSGDNKQIIDTLVSRYVNLFGRASQEVCKESVQDLIAELPVGDVPSSLE